MPDSLACSAALSLKSTTGLNASYALCSGQSVYCRIFGQSCVRSRCGRLFLGMKYTSRNGFDTPIVHHPSCQDKRSGPPGPSANMCEESSGQVWSMNTPFLGVPSLFQLHFSFILYTCEN